MIKNSILKTVTLAAVVVFLDAWSKINADSWLPVILAFASALWIGMFVYVNVFNLATERSESK